MGRKKVWYVGQLDEILNKFDSIEAAEKEGFVIKDSLFNARPRHVENRILEVMKEKKVRNYEISQALGIPPKAFSNILHGLTVGLIDALRISEYLGCTVNDIYSYKLDTTYERYPKGTDKKYFYDIKTNEIVSREEKERRIREGGFYAEDIVTHEPVNSPGERKMLVAQYINKIRKENPGMTREEALEAFTKRYEERFKEIYIKKEKKESV